MPPEAPDVVYRRASVRFRCDRRSARRLFVIESYKTIPAQIANISLTGVGLLVEQPMNIGTYVFVELEAQVPLELFAKVAHATPKGDVWLVGCELMMPLTQAELKLFAAR